MVPAVAGHVVTGEEGDGGRGGGGRGGGGVEAPDMHGVVLEKAKERTERAGFNHRHTYIRVR